MRVPPGAIAPSCAPVTVPNHRPVPLLALQLDVRPRAVVSAQERRPARGTWVEPATGAVARDYILDPRDLDKRIAPPPPGFRRAGANALVARLHPLLKRVDRAPSFEVGPAEAHVA